MIGQKEKRKICLIHHCASLWVKTELCWNMQELCYLEALSQNILKNMAIVESFFVPPS
jgi:hypothetical protein